MKNLLNIKVLSKTLNNLSVGLGIFKVPDLEDIKSIRYVFMNKVLLYEMRKEPEEVFGKRIIEVAPEAYEHEQGLNVIETYRKVASEGGSVHLGLVEYSNHMVAGTYECSVHYIKKHYVYVMLRNVTELEQTKNELEKNKELSQFAYVVSHDLKEPLNNISNLVALIEGQYAEKLDEQGNKLLSLISDSSNRMRNLINDILEYSSIGHQKEMILVDCNKILEFIQLDLESLIKETKTIIEVEKLPKIKGYRTEIRLLFQNLISNAIKFSKPEKAPKIKIYAKKENGWTFTI